MKKTVCFSIVLLFSFAMSPLFCSHTVGIEADDIKTGEYEAYDVKRNCHVNCDVTCERDCDSDRCWAITIKNGYFYPKDKTLRCIFDCCGSKGGYWFEVAARRSVWRDLNVEVSGSYFGKEGRVICANNCVNECTKVKIPTLGFGLKYFFNFNKDECEDSCFREKFSLFIGAGLRVFFYKEENCSSYVINCFKETTVGGMVNAGFEYDITKSFFMGLFLDYNFKKLQPCCDNNCYNNCCLTSQTTQNACQTSCCPSCFHCIDLGGLVAGISLGFKF